jgi:hypothetical protein
MPNGKKKDGGFTLYNSRSKQKPQLKIVFTGLKGGSSLPNAGSAREVPFTIISTHMSENHRAFK